MHQAILEACTADVQAVKDRDAACDKFMHCMLYYKGFQAIQSHRIAHWLWKQGRKVIPKACQLFNLIREALRSHHRKMLIHPNAAADACNSLAEQGV